MIFLLDLTDDQKKVIKDEKSDDEHSDYVDSVSISKFYLK
jgi:hypothetical protein